MGNVKIPIKQLASYRATALRECFEEIEVSEEVIAKLVRLDQRETLRGKLQKINTLTHIEELTATLSTALVDDRPMLEDAMKCLEERRKLIAARILTLRVKGYVKAFGVEVEVTGDTSGTERLKLVRLPDYTVDSVAGDGPTFSRECELSEDALDEVIDEAVAEVTGLAEPSRHQPLPGFESDREVVKGGLVGWLLEKWSRFQEAWS